MMKLNYIRIAAFFKNIWNGMLGIFHEVIFTYLFILAGFLVCLLWWGILIK
ncbi:MAG: hypothetical protein HZC19_00585 [Candidatus Omnitrophica bacterium]|nr:hypothetical protein [Candidatus Omnitrophota bacterium]